MDAASQKRLEVPEPDLKPEQLISRARALRPMVQAEAQEAERGLLRGVAQRVHQSGLLPVPAAAPVRRL